MQKKSSEKGRREERGEREREGMEGREGEGREKRRGGGGRRKKRQKTKAKGKRLLNPPNLCFFFSPFSRPCPPSCWAA
jgi:hypothetical protein